MAFHSPSPQNAFKANGFRPQGADVSDGPGIPSMDRPRGRAHPRGAPPPVTARRTEKTQQAFALRLSRLPRVDETPGLVALSISGASGDESRKVGDLTDVALRGRLAHFGIHSANEVATIRRALQADDGQITVHEDWPGLDSCLKFWNDFTGSQIRLVEWTCECEALHRDNVGANVGETYSRGCRCGRVRRITTVTDIPPRR
jgi:hypothetical protein